MGPDKANRRLRGAAPNPRSNYLSGNGSPKAAGRLRAGGMETGGLPAARLQLSPLRPGQGDFERSVSVMDGVNRSAATMANATHADLRTGALPSFGG